MDTEEITKKRNREEADEKADEFAANRLCCLRKENKLNKVDFAALLSISYNQYWKYETGITALKLGRVRAICKVLEISPLEFFEGEFPDRRTLTNED